MSATRPKSLKANAKKSGRKSGRGPGTFRPGDDPRRGRGPKPGAVNAGRPPSDVRKALLGAFGDRISILKAFADDAALDVPNRLRAIDLMAKYGIGQRHEVSSDEWIVEQLRQLRTIVLETLPREQAEALLARVSQETFVR